MQTKRSEVANKRSTGAAVGAELENESRWPPPAEALGVIWTPENGNL